MAQDWSSFFQYYLHQNVISSVRQLDSYDRELIPNWRDKKNRHIFQKILSEVLRHLIFFDPWKQRELQ